MKRLVAIAVVAMMVIAIAGLAQPVLADGGGSFNETDGRISPRTGDRVAVYCHNTSVDVYGLDPLSSGHYLTTFSMDELTSGQTAVHNVSLGTVSLILDSM